MWWRKLLIFIVGVNRSHCGVCSQNNIVGCVGVQVGEFLVVISDTLTLAAIRSLRDEKLSTQSSNLEQSFGLQVQLLQPGIVCKRGA